MPANMMRNAMRPLYPESVPIDAQLIANMRIKIKALIRKREYNDEQLWKLPELDSDYLLSDDLVPPPSLFGEAVDDDRASFIDEASRQARRELFQLLNGPRGESLNIQLFLQKLNEIDSGFTSCKSADGNGYLTGCAGCLLCRGPTLRCLAALCFWT